MGRSKKFVAGLLMTGWLVTSAGIALAQKDRRPTNKEAEFGDGREPVSAPVTGGAESSEQGAPPMGPPPEHRPSPAEQQQMMQQAMGGMMGLMMESMARSMAKPEFAQNMAAFMRNYYKALIAQGFTEEEALNIVTSSGGLPQMGGRK